MKYIFFFLTSLIATNSYSQSGLTFDKRFVECEDEWVVFSMSKDSSYTFGFIYIDEQAGLTLNREGDFKYNLDGTIIVERLKETNIKVRLQANSVKVALIPESMFKDLGIERYPEWLKFYQTDTGTAKRLYNWGYMYNGWNECEKALGFLLRAREKDHHYQGLNVELAFSYNCLKQYEKAEEILEEEIKIHSTDSYVNKEYIYTLTNNNKIEKAIQQFRNSIQALKDKQYHAENCFNILQYYYHQKDKDNFNTWYKELSKHPNENKLITQYADNMKKDLIK